MNFLEILNNFKIFNNIIFYPLLIIIVAYSVAFLLSFYDSKRRYVYIFTGIPIVVSIICVSANALYQLGNIINTGKITDSLFLFQMFILLIGMLMLCGITTEFKLKHIFVSHAITEVLHACFYYYCNHYDAGIISGALHPTFEYLIVLASVYFFISHFSLPDQMGFSMGNYFLDQLMPTNEGNSHKTIVLLQAYSMIIHSTAMVFMYSLTIDYWVYAIALFVVLLQLIIFIMCLRIMHIYPSSANVPFYVGAHLMIIKLLIDALYTNYKIFKENKPLNWSVQPQFFNNKFIYLFVYILVVCILSCEVAYAADKEPSSPVSESNIFNRISQSGLSQLLKYATFYEGVSIFREWLQEQVGLSSEIDEFSTAVENCHNAKSDLENIPFKYPKEQQLINEAKYILKGSDIQSSNLSRERLEQYVNKLEDITVRINAQYDTYYDYKNSTTDYVLRRLWNVKNCCCGPHQ